MSIPFMNDRFGGAMPPLVLLTVQKPRERAWDHAYMANLVDVTPSGFVVEVSRLDRDAGWCYDLDLMWMAYGFAKPLDAPAPPNPGVQPMRPMT